MDETLEPPGSRRSPHRNVISHSRRTSSVSLSNCAFSAKTNKCQGLGSRIPKGMSWTSLLFSESLVPGTLRNGDRGFRNSSRSRISRESRVIPPPLNLSLTSFREPLLGESLVVDSYGSASTDTKIDKSHRDSLTAFLDSPELPPQTDEDVVINCIEQRATQFQGHIPVQRLESLQVVMCFLPLKPPRWSIIQVRRKSTISQSLWLAWSRWQGYRKTREPSNFVFRVPCCELYWRNYSISQYSTTAGGGMVRCTQMSRWRGEGSGAGGSFAESWNGDLLV